MSDEKRTIALQSEPVSVRPHTSFVNIIIITTACLGGFLYGYSANIISGSLAQVSFISKYLSGTDAAARTDGMLGGFLAGGFIGAVIQAPISNKFGRRVANAVSAVILIIAAALQAGSVHIAMFLCFRVLCGIGAGMTISNTPVYLSEVSPPHTRGLLVGMQGIGIVSSYITCSAAALGFSFVSADYQWRLNFVILTFFAILLLISLRFLPESPRWLMENGREKDAKKVLEYLHASKEDPNATIAHAELVQIRAQVKAESSLPKGFIYIFSSPHLRKRAFCTIMLWTMAQGTGITCIANLIPTLMSKLGFGTTVQLGLGVAWTVCLQIGCCINVYCLDRIGRVKLLVIGGFGSAVILSIEAALQKYYLTSTNTAGINAAVAFYFLFGTFFTSTIECTAYVYGSEIWPTHLRSEGSTLAYASFFGNAIAYSAPAAVAFDNIGWEYYMVFVAVTVVCTVALMLTFPETAGLTLEEVGLKFGDTVEVDFQQALRGELEGKNESA